MVTRTSSRSVSALQGVPAKRRTRLDIQGLRALAVVLVVMFHLWPNRITGGYVGVDVFFVISGFLITAHLLSEVDRTGTVSLTHFWARRIRRLLPAAFTVLAASLIAAFLIIPRSMLQQALNEISASAVYAQNWLLAADSIDYLAADNTPSLVQHYWSLAVEEQFYFVWPLLILLALWLGRTRRRDGSLNRRAILLALGIVFLGSLGFSVYETAVSPSSAYFITPTRAWEFAAGALLAFAPAGGLANVRLGSALQLLLSWGGIALIGFAALTFDATTAFPGYMGLLPVAGAAMILYSGESTSRWSTSRLFNLRPVQLIGDLSYSIYLWHWPLIVAAPFVLKSDLTMTSRLAIVVAAMALAWLTKRFVEDPARLVKFGVQRRRFTYAFAAAGMVAILAVTSLGTLAIAEQQRELDAVAAASEQCLGASSLVNGDSELCQEFEASGDQLFPTLASRSRDTEGQYDCYVNPKENVRYRECTFGDVRSEIRIAITGDSHAASLIPGLVEAAEREGWAVDALVGNGCQIDGPKCGARDQFDEKILNGDYDLVLATATRAGQPEAEDLIEDFRRLTDAGVTLIPIVDVPTYLEKTDQCVDQSNGTSSSAGLCHTTRDAALTTLDDQYESAADALNLATIDLTNVFCGEEQCPAVIGNSLVYRDTSSHITATFSRSLATELGKQISGLLR